MNTLSLGLPLIAGLVAVALLFDFLNGLHDAANSIATVVSTRVLSPRAAVAWAAFFNFIAFLFFGLHVAGTVGTGIVAAEVVDPRVVFGALMGAISWNLITWWPGIPTSSSHALIGGIVGAGVAKAGIGAVVWSGLGPTGAAIVLSPVLGFALALLLALVVSWGFRRWNPFAVDRTFRRLQLVSAALYSLGHGGNDAQKTMGIIAVLLYSEGLLGSEFHVPFWVVLSCQAAMGLGTSDWGMANCSHDGVEDHSLDSGAGLLRRDERRRDALLSDRVWNSGLDDAHHYGCYCRSRHITEGFGSTVECCEKYPCRLDFDTSWISADCGSVLRREQTAGLISRSRCFPERSSSFVRRSFCQTDEIDGNQESRFCTECACP